MPESEAVRTEWAAWGQYIGLSRDVGIVVGLPIWAWVSWMDRKDRNLSGDPNGPY